MGQCHKRVWQPRKDHAQPGRDNPGRTSAVSRRAAKLLAQHCGRIDQGGPVPGQVAAADQRGVDAGEAFRAVVGGEPVRLIRQHDQIRASRHDLIERTARVLIAAASEPASGSDSA